ncbi:hypothetical protein [uncultured Paraglaciecola sp.]|uniref:hypothetical protein n=1 Tax=uncultured Paraglaciecola sp. TaxID=1765024 RepID=UPI0025D3948A|nr:hypothetical protein [uncultured Paraglaciecola sp.]
MQITTSKNKQVLSKKEIERAANFEKLEMYSQGKGIASFAGGFPVVNNLIPEITDIVTHASSQAYKIYSDQTRTKMDQVRLASKLAKDAERRLLSVGEKVFQTIKDNGVKVDSAFTTMKSKGETSDHPRSQAIRERLQNMEYGELRETLSSNEHVAGIFLSDPKMLYSLDDKQHSVVRDGLLSKHHPEAYEAMKSQDFYFKAYEAVLGNTQDLVNIIASKEDVKKAESMRFEV